MLKREKEGGMKYQLWKRDKWEGEGGWNDFGKDREELYRFMRA